MKTIQTLSLLLLFCLSAEAQSHKTNLIKTIDAINSILCQDRNANFTNTKLDNLEKLILLDKDANKLKNN